MVELVGAVSCGPNALHRGFLVLRVRYHAVYLIELNKTFGKGGVRHHADFNEDAFDGQGSLFSRVFVAHGKPLKKLFALHLDRLCVIHRLEIRMRENLFNGDFIPLKLLVAMNERNALAVGKELHGRFKARVSAAHNRNVRIGIQRAVAGRAVGKSLVFKCIRSRYR